MRKKIVTIIVFISLIFIVIIAITQADDFDFRNIQLPQVNKEPLDEEMFAEEFLIEDVLPEDWQDEEIPEWVKSTRWFRSNAGGMVLEEVSSRASAFRNEYALVIDFINRRDLPEYLLQYYSNRYFIEVRVLYKNSEETRKQWIFRDKAGTTRLIAVFVEQEDDDDDEEIGFISEIAYNDEDVAVVSSSDADESGDADTSGDLIGDDEVKNEDKIREPANGFIEIFDENSFLLTEFRFLEDEGTTKTNYIYNEGYIIRAEVLEWDKDDGGEFKAAYTDFFRYNRSAFLRSVERVFFKEQQITAADNTIRTVFPNNIMDTARNQYFMDAKLNSYPEFFGDLIARKNNKIVFTTDERGRILTQILYDTEKEENVIWTIVNIWSNDRIASITKTEGDTVLLAQYEYDSGGSRTLERNLRNGVLERLVRSEKSRDIEELYMDNAVVLRAVWEDGRKISETRGNPGIRN